MEANMITLFPPVLPFNFWKAAEKTSVKVLKIPELMKYGLLSSTIKTIGNLLGAVQIPTGLSPTLFWSRTHTERHENEFG